MLRYFAFLILSSVLLSASAQHTCGFDHYLDANPEIKAQLINQTQSFQKQNKKQQLRRGFTYSYDTVYEIKVVFHVLYNNSFENIPDSCIYTQMEVLNEDFNRTNRDTGETLDVFKPVAGKLPFKFVLADKDPDGNPTSGIIRKSTNITAFNQTSGGNYDSRMKFDVLGGSDAWDTDKYLNIWVCDMFGVASGGVAGYATPPIGAANWPSNVQFPNQQQGAVVHFYTVGRYNPTATSNGSFGLGRTATHELGHYFGLFHTWGLRQSTCSEAWDDFIDDTPNTASANNGCNLRRNSCDFTVPGDLVDMVQNYMDYTFGSCQNIFTEEQCALMLFNMKQFRPEIYTPIVSKDSTFIPDTLDVVPVLYSNPGDRLIVAANIFTSTQFKMNVFDVTGRSIVKDFVFSADKPLEIPNSIGWSEGQYIVQLTNLSNNEMSTFRFQKIYNLRN